MTTASRVAIVRPGTQQIEIRTVVLPDPGLDQVVIEQHASGVCHSQLHQLHGERTEPILLGHESTGVVIAVGAAVDHVGVGDEVLVTWVPRAPSTPYRAAERSWVDVGDGTIATSLNVFTWATHTIVDEQYVVKAPANTPMDVASIVGCAVMTGSGAVTNTAGVQRGDSVAVWGVGGVGLAAVAAARFVGATPIIAVDLDDAKLEFARQFGATQVVNASNGDAVAQVRRLTPGNRPSDAGGVDHAFDCIGTSRTIRETVDAARGGWLGERRGGTAVLVGVPTQDMILDARSILGGEKRFIGSAGGSCTPDVDFPVFLDWYHRGELDLDALVTERVGLDQINEIVHELEAGQIMGRAILDLT